MEPSDEVWEPETPEVAGSSNGSADAARPGIILTLAELPAQALLDENALAHALGVSTRTIRRMVDRHELPPGIPLAGRTTWLAGRVLDHLIATSERVEKEAERNAARLRVTT